MNPTQIQSDANKIVRVTNISNFDFTAEMGAMYGGVPYFVPAGKSLLMPMPVGKHIATHLARQIMLRKAPTRDDREIDGKGSDRKLWDAAGVDELVAKIVTNVYEEQVAAPQSEAQILAAKVEELNKTTPPETTVSATTYKDKAEVIAELEKRSIPFNPRTTKANLEKLLVPAKPE